VGNEIMVPCDANHLNVHHIVLDTPAFDALLEMLMKIQLKSPPESVQGSESTQGSVKEWESTPVSLSSINRKGKWTAQNC
jgi:hypothetical protein